MKPEDIELLKRLKGLLDAGILTEEEFGTQKAFVLGGSKPDIDLDPVVVRGGVEKPVSSGWTDDVNRSSAPFPKQVESNVIGPSTRRFPSVFVSPEFQVDEGSGSAREVIAGGTSIPNKLTGLWNQIAKIVRNTRIQLGAGVVAFGLILVAITNNEESAPTYPDSALSEDGSPSDDPFACAEELGDLRSNFYLNNLRIAPQTKLQHADLSGTDLSHVDLQGASLWGINLVGTDLSGACLRDADLSYADLTNANLDGADLRGADLYYDATIDNTSFRNALLSDQFGWDYILKSDFSGADLSNSNLSHGGFQEGSLFIGSNLAGSDLAFCDLRGTSFNNADLTGVDLSYAELTGAVLEGANLKGADLGRADLTDADLRGANLAGADLTQAILKNSNLTGANLTGANLSAAVLTEAILDGAIMPDGSIHD